MMGKPRIGFIGVGIMGTPMAGHLATTCLATQLVAF